MKEAKLYKRAGSPKWYFYFFDKNGKKVCRSSGTEDEQQARKIALAVEARWDEQEASKSSPKASPTLQEASDRWLASKTLGKGIAPATEAVYRRAIRYLIKHFGKDFPIFDWNQSLMLGYCEVRKDKTAPYTLEGECNVAKFILNFYAEIEEFQGSTKIVPKAIRNSYKPRKRFLTPKEMATLFSRIREEDPHLVDYVYAYVSLGIRKGELFLIQKKHVSIPERTVEVFDSKGKIWRKNPLNDGMIELFQRRMENKGNDEVLFPAVSNWGYRIQKWRKGTDIEHFTIHDLRRSTGSLLASENVPLKTIASILGHKNIQTTARTYSHLLDKAAHDAIAKLPVPGIQKTEQMERKPKRLSQEHREKIAQAKRGKKRPPFSEEWKMRISRGMKGKQNALKRKEKGALDPTLN